MARYRGARGGSSVQEAFIGVIVAPVDAFTRMPRPANSSASVRVTLPMAPLLAG